MYMYKNEYLIQINVHVYVRACVSVRGCVSVCVCVRRWLPVYTDCISIIDKSIQ